MVFIKQRVLQALAALAQSLTKRQGMEPERNG